MSPTLPTPTTPSTLPDPLEHQLQVWRHRIFLRWLLSLATLFGTVEVIAALPLASRATGVTGAIILAYSAAVVIAYRALAADRLEASVRITWVGIIVAAVSIAIVQPFLWPPLAMIPLVAVGVALPYSRGARLVRLLVTCDVAAVVIAALGLVGEPPATPAALFDSVFRIAATGAVATLVLVLLFLFSSRLTSALEASVSANRALVAAQDALSAERERLDTTLRSIGDGVVATDAERRVVFVNHVAADLAGWPAEEAIGRPIDDVLDVRRLEEDPTGPVLVARDGRLRPIAHQVAPIRARDGAIHGAVIVFRDVSDERRLAEERRELDRRTLANQQLESLATLAGGIAQQFNNLLVVILGNAAIVRDELGAAPPPAAESALAEIETASNRASVLAHQMLAFGGRGRFLVSAVDVDRAVTDAIDLLAPNVPADVSIRHEPGLGVPLVDADRGQVQQLLRALIANAIEAVGNGPGAITIRTGATTIAACGGRVGTIDAAEPTADGPIGAGMDSPVVAIEVIDTGSGMDDATRAQIFQPFFSTKFTGRGLGLAAALGIVRGHGGRIDVDSAPGRGATFTVLLPAREPSPAVASAPGPSAAGALAQPAPGGSAADRQT